MPQPANGHVRRQLRQPRRLLQDAMRLRSWIIAMSDAPGYTDPAEPVEGRLPW